MASDALDINNTMEPVLSYTDTSEPSITHTYKCSSIVAAAWDSPIHQNWTVVDTDAQGETLFINGELQSCKNDEYIYHEMFAHSLLQGCQNPTRVLIVGGAEGCMLREVLRWSTVKHVTQVDWDEPLVEYFKSVGSSWNAGAYKDPRAHIVCKNVVDWLKKTEADAEADADAERFDAIFVDLMDPKDPEFLYSLLKTLKGRMNPRGGISINAGPVHVSAHAPTVAVELAKFMHKEFPSPTFGHVALKLCVPSFLGEWCFLMATSTQWSSNLYSLKTPANLKRFTHAELTRISTWTPDYPEELVNFAIPCKKLPENGEKLTHIPHNTESIDFYYE